MPSRPAPISPKSKAPMVVAAILAVVVVVGGLIVVKPWSSDSDDPKDSNVSAGSTEGNDDPAGDSDEPRVDPSDPADTERMANLSRDLATVDDLAPLASGDRSALAWRLSDEQIEEFDSDSLGGNECYPEPVPVGQAGRQFALVDQSGGIHGAGFSIVRRFASTEEAKEFLDAHQGREPAACMKAQNHETLSIQTMGAKIIADLEEFADGVDGGRAASYVATYERPEGRCSWFSMTYWNQVGPNVVSSTFETCGNPFDPEVETAIVRATVKRLEGDSLAVG